MGSAQMLYAVAAVALAATVSYIVMSGSIAVEQQEFQNEIATQYTGVAHEVFEHIGNWPFDARTDSLVNEEAPSSPGELTAEANFGGGWCYSAGCDIDNFDGDSTLVQREGTAYVVHVDVKYVNETDPTQLAGTQTYAKRVMLTITNPLLRDKELDMVMPVEISRVFTYLKTTI